MGGCSLAMARYTLWWGETVKPILRHAKEAEAFRIGALPGNAESEPGSLLMYVRIQCHWSQELYMSQIANLLERFRAALHTSAQIANASDQL